MEIRVVDKAGKALPSAQEALEALGLRELWKAVINVPYGEVAKAIAALLEFCDLYPTEEGSWRGSLGYGVAVHLKRDKGGWVVEVAVPFEYDEGTALLLKRVQHLAEDVERTRSTVKALEGRIEELEELVREREGRREKGAAERLAEVLERLVELLEERE
jgi:hypothetical protein